MATLAATLAACLIAAGGAADSHVLHHQVDLIEVNHCYDAQGQLMFDQLLFYDWCPTKSHYDVRDWCLLKSPQQLPRRSHDAGGYVAMWQEGAVMRQVHAQAMRESWTLYDPERVEQQYLPKERRRAFAKPRPHRPLTAEPSAASARRVTKPGEVEAVLRR